MRFYIEIKNCFNIIIFIIGSFYFIEKIRLWYNFNFDFVFIKNYYKLICSDVFLYYVLF